MKKTVSINIKGMNFMIEEDAYELLHDYMNRLEKSLQGQKGSKDIVEDIELRIAELCQQNISDKKQVVEKEDIELILKTLGEPEDYIEDDSENSGYSEFQQSESSKSQKHLYRDIYNAKIAGICAGLSNYFHTDVLVIRILFLVFLFIGGFGLPLYIILWIVIPKTSSTIDRLKMRGKAITVDNVKDEIEQAAARINSSSKSFSDRIRNDKENSKRFSRIGKLITTIVGFGLIFAGISFLILFLILFFGGLRFLPIISENSYLSVNQISELLLSDSNDVFNAWLGIFLAIFSGVLFLVSNGTFLLIGLKSKWVKITSLALIGFGIVGTIIFINIGMKTGRDFATDAELEKELFVLDTPELKIEAIQEKRADLDGFQEKINFNHAFDHVMIVKKDKIISNGIKFIYKSSKDSIFHIYQNHRAHSFSYDKALIKAKNIQSEIKLDSSTLFVNPNFSFPKFDKIRLQQVTIIIEIPKNKWVQINDEKITLDFYMEENTKYGYLNSKGEYDSWY
jgi:phage shock protein PspC (stress-responsive transcriptional regulator)